MRGQVADNLHTGLVVVDTSASGQRRKLTGLRAIPLQVWLTDTGLRAASIPYRSVFWRRSAPVLRDGRRVSRISVALPDAGPSCL